VCSIVNKADLTVCCVCGSTKWNQVGGRAAEEALKLTVQQLLFKQKEAERKALELKALEPEAPGPEALEIAVVGDASSPAARLPTVIDDEQTFFVSQRDLFERETEGLLQAVVLSRHPIGAVSNPPPCLLLYPLPDLTVALAPTRQIPLYFPASSGICRTLNGRTRCALIWLILGPTLYHCHPRAMQSSPCCTSASTT